MYYTPAQICILCLIVLDPSALVIWSGEFRHKMLKRTSYRIPPVASSSLISLNHEVEVVRHDTLFAHFGPSTLVSGTTFALALHTALSVRNPTAIVELSS